MGYLDTKEFAKQMREQAIRDSNGNVICSDELWELIAKTFESLPDADVVEVKHGKWKYKLQEARSVHYSSVVTCDNCGHSFARLDGVNFNYCPNCGAKMDKE